jgi:hypothetical protein
VSEYGNKLKIIFKNVRTVSRKILGFCNIRAVQNVPYEIEIDEFCFWVQIAEICLLLKKLKLLFE